MCALLRSMLLVWALVLTSCAATLPDGRPIPRHPLLDYHKAFRFSDPWRLTPEGVQIRGEGVPRTRGAPLTTSWIWKTWGEEINTWAWRYQVPAELIVAVIATEATPIPGQPNYTRNPKCVREEPGFTSDTRTPGKVSVGLMQLTLATARLVADKELPGVKINRKYLQSPANNIRLGTAFIALQARGQLANVATLLDPPVVFASYNAGGLYRMGGRKNDWKMRQYPYKTGRHVDRAVAYFNDAIAALPGEAPQATWDWYDHLASLDKWRF